MNESTFSVFPPDVNAVMDHGKRAVSTFPIAITMVAVIALCYWFFLYDLQVKYFDFEEKVVDMDMENYPLNKKKAIISSLVFIGCIILFITQPFGWELGMISVAGVIG